MEKIANGLNTRWLALRLLEGDRSLIRSIKENIGYDIQEHELLKDLLEEILEELKGKGLDRNKIRDMIVSSIVRTGRLSIIGLLSLKMIAIGKEIEKSIKS